MKLNHRDRILISIVMVAAVWLLGIFFAIMPAFEGLSDKRKELDERQDELSKLVQKNEEDKDLPNRIKNAYLQSLDISGYFYKFQQNQEAQHEVDDLLDNFEAVNEDMKITQYSARVIKPFNYVSTLVLTDYDKKAEKYNNLGSSAVDNNTSSTASKKFEYQDDDGKKITVDPNSGLKVGGYDVSFKIHGRFNAIQKFCDKIAENVKDKSLVVSTLNIDSVDPSTTDANKFKQVDTYANNEVDAQIEINFMVVMKLDKPQEVDKADVDAWEKDQGNNSKKDNK